MEAEKALQQIHEEFTECTLCTELYAEPKMLPCMHTFCLVCLMQHGKGKRAGERVQCPLCRKEFTLEAGGFNALPTNFYLNRLVELRQMSSQSPKTDVLCSECSSEKSDEAACIPVAESYCVECAKELCGDCAGEHKFRGHILRDLDGKLSGLQCSEHPKETNSLYCNDCSVLICVKCFCQKHNSHKCLDAEDVAASCERPINEEVKTLKLTATKFKELASRQESGVQAFGRSRQELENKIAVQARALKELIDRRAAQLQSEVLEVSKTSLVEMQKRVTLAESSVRGIEGLVEFAEKIKHTGSHVDVINISELLTVRRKEFETSLEENKAQRVQLTFEASDIDKLITELHGDMIGKITSIWRTIDEDSERGCSRCGRANHTVIRNLHVVIRLPAKTESLPSLTPSHDDSSDSDSSDSDSDVPVKCERCGDPHITLACGYPSDICCYQCHETGHHIRICPNK